MDIQVIKIVLIVTSLALLLTISFVVVFYVYYFNRKSILEAENLSLLDFNKSNQTIANENDSSVLKYKGISNKIIQIKSELKSVDEGGKKETKIVVEINNLLSRILRKLRLLSE